MATRRRRPTATNTRRRRRPTAAANPRRRRRTNRTTIFTAAPRRTNSRRRTATNPRRRARRRNPSVKFLVVGSMFAAGGAMAQKTIAGFIPIRAEGVLGLGVELGVAYVTAMVGEKLLGGSNAQAFALGAAGAFGVSALNYVFGLASSAVGQLSPAAAPAAPPQLDAPTGGVSDVAYYDGMADMVESPDYWPGYNG